MKCGAQLSLYVMADDFVRIILSSIAAIGPYRDRLRIETDDISTLIVGPPELIFPTMRDMFVAAAESGYHVALHATVSRGCPGEPDMDICEPAEPSAFELALDERKKRAAEAVENAQQTGQRVAVQFSLYPLGPTGYMDEIYGCIDFLKTSPVFDRAKNYCTRLAGDAGPVFEAVSQAWLSFGDSDAHVTIDLTASANSPSRG